MQIPEDRPTSRITTRHGLLMLLPVLLVALVLLWPSQQHPELPTSFVEAGQIREAIPVFGRLRAEVERSIIPKISGTIVDKQARPGDQVQPDDVILSLSNITVEQAFVEAKMAVMSAQANIKELHSELLSQQRKLKNQITLTVSSLALAEVELAANEKLFDDDIISELEVKKARMLFQKAQLAAQLAKDELADFSQLKEAKHAVSRARLAQTEARFDVAKVNKQSLQITAQMAGVIQSLNNDIKLGQWLDSGRSLGSVAQTDRLYAEVKVMASFASKLKPGQAVNLDIKGQGVNGVISHIEPNVVDNQIQLYITPEVLPATARLNIEVSGQILVFDKSALVINKPEYVTKGQTKQALWVVDSDGELQRREAELGIITDQQIEIVSGVSVGEQVALAIPGV